jgi:hypothetical protein
MKENILFLIAGIAACVAASLITVSDVAVQASPFAEVTIAEGRPAGCRMINGQQHRWREPGVRPSPHC